MMLPTPTNYRSASRRTRLAGYTALALFVGTIGVWGAVAPLAGAVIASGQFVAESNVKKVQHQNGGIVGELMVREGDRVQANALLVRLDATLARANLQIITRQLDELAARTGRLEAEREQAAAVAMPQRLLERQHEPDVAALITAETSLFAIRAAARDGLRAQLGKRISQLRFEIIGLEEQRRAKERESLMIERELVGVRTLFRQNLVQINRLSQLEREAASLDGQRGQLTAQIAQAEGRTAETELQILQLVEDLRAEAMKELRDIQGRTGELLERRVAAEDQLRRIDIRAPVSGLVHQLQVHTVGGVISPAEPVMLIVPTMDELHLEVRVQPSDYDLISLGQSVVVKLHAFNQRTTPELNGTVSRVSADATREPQIGLAYFLVRVTVPKAERDRIMPLDIIPGMQADAFFKTGDRTLFSYLSRPLVDQFAKAFRER